MSRLAKCALFVIVQMAFNATSYASPEFDAFPFKLNTKRIHVKPVTIEDYKPFEQSVDGGVKPDYISLSFLRTSPKNIISKYFGRRSSKEKKIIAQYFKNAPACYIDVPKKLNHSCDFNTVYDRIHIRDGSLRIISGNQIEDLDSLHFAGEESEIGIPTALYVEILNTKQLSSYELSIIVPKDAGEEELTKAAEYFSKIIPIEKALYLLRTARNTTGRVLVDEFLPNSIPQLMNTFDSRNIYDCHLFAMQFFSSEFDTSNQVVPWAMINDPNYFEEINSGEPLRFGDLIRFGYSDRVGYSHSVIYLVDGFVAMKDNTGLEWSFRIAHLNDLGKSTQESSDYIRYLKNNNPTKVFRRTSKAFLF